MNVPRLAAIVAAALFFVPASTLAAQTTWVVSNRGGGQFTEIQPAIDAAQPGDRIEVLATGANYLSFLTPGVRSKIPRPTKY